MNHHARLEIFGHGGEGTTTSSSSLAAARKKTTTAATDPTTTDLSSSGSYKDRIYKEKIEIELANLDKGNSGSDNAALDDSQLLPKGMLSSSTLEENIQSSTSFDMCCYALFLRVNAVVIEAPLCAAEAILRATFFFILFVFLGTLCTCRRSSLVTTALLMLNECIVSIAAAASLLVPGLILFIYRNYNADAAWHLATLPTVLGWVDCQRFCIISFSGGATASHFLPVSGSGSDNGANAPSILSMRDICGVVVPSDYLPHDGIREVSVLGLFRRHSCNGSVVLCVPRRMLAAISDVIAGAEVAAEASLDDLIA